MNDQTLPPSEPSDSAPQSTQAEHTPFRAFCELPLSLASKKAIKKLGFSQLTAIQAKILPYTLVGYDAIGQAQTGTGKTAAFLLTIIESLLNSPFGKDEQRYLGEPRALVLAPTRELAQQIYVDALALTEFSTLYSACVTGGSDFDKQEKALHAKPLDLLIGTPGRIIDWVQKGVLFLDRVELYVLDEADRMLDMGFIPDIKRIVRRLPANTHRQSLLFSATFNTDVMNLAYRWLNNPIFVEIEATQKTNSDITQSFYWLSDHQKIKALEHLLQKYQDKKTIIFANRKDQVRRLTEKLSKHTKVVEMSGDVAQHKREKHLKAFKTNEVKVLIATDVAGRGIHVDDVGLVINFSLPDMADDYVHRIGRTGRAGQTGLAISLIGEDDAFNLPILEKYLNTKLELSEFEFV